LIIYLLCNAEFALPGKKQLLKLNHELEVIVIDVTETPIERPKKSAPPALRFPQRKDGASTEKILQWEEKKAYFKISNNC
jgi:hypothetical protein